VRVDGPKELVALRDGYRESAEFRADLMRECARRAMRAPGLAVGGGALACYGFPAEHRLHLRTMNPIESTFATVLLRTKATCGGQRRPAPFVPTEQAPS
jgi:transposase-like protein